MKHLRPQCAKCVYWVCDHTAEPATSGHCHRFPPGLFINPDTGVVIQKFVTTDLHQWCGEWSGDEELFARMVRASVVGAASAPRA